jgi:transposase
MKRKSKDARITKVYRATKSVAAVAKAVGFSRAGAYRAVRRLGLRRK